MNYETLHRRAFGANGAKLAYSETVSCGHPVSTEFVWTRGVRKSSFDKSKNKIMIAKHER
ncbi:MAG: hypothetical protein A2W65_02090 [Candidatus Taylorbacteria bacterium RIFCSPLOWO2_02_50_13]|nr:MAG: hypothetical protein A2759_02430 [Candidatus Taylorbacteria bacterium RIFCSPHIGHO2_01_FULL_49_60]OHA35190.1 MAG: hypothetical protein A3B27_01195 [Candidatus Taylorbacteria bacterium RIFCSPLOWO2_01_FULL_50_130]OHA37597.1 MAG: hypothetical protein A2W65_02090 [Candidatus Taylorbacteria bacterium RIFCSPLOWO2_02_50_13]OHA45936.1 MAG: hypothetical protein A3G61_00130 [Candidatus Taylorbacteria bacterium RIFCSPLOWO2_12_FULL_49_67]HCB35810.1 hypothetical protein [Candidatus Taylorbacteria bac